MSDFQKNRARRDGLQVYCRAWAAVRDRLSLARHREKRRAYKRQVRLQNRLRILEYLLRHPCVDCGESRPAVLDFDHCARKSAPVSLLVHNSVSWGKIEEEIARCQVRCANCHRLKTARERRWLAGMLQQEPKSQSGVSNQD